MEFEVEASTDRFDPLDDRWLAHDDEMRQRVVRLLDDAAGASGRRA